MKRTLNLIIIFILLLPLNGNAEWKSGTVISYEQIKRNGANNYFEIMAIDDGLLQRMRKGGSLPTTSMVDHESLRYLKVLHYNYSGEIQTGEIVCNKLIADDLMSIFKELFRHKYQIQKIGLIDDYGANDEASMKDGNSSAFCYRKVKGVKRLSKHAMGMAIDINPINNPCVKSGTDGKVKSVQPDTVESHRHVRRSADVPHQIDKNDLCYKLFISHGFRWGGSWRSKKDYQHFEK